MNVFRVTGKFLMGRAVNPFTIEAIGSDEADAKNRVLSTLGSKHRVNRHQITIESATKIGNDDVTNPVVAKKLQMVK